MSIPAVKGVEIGIGFKSAELRGEENSDQMGESEYNATFTGYKAVTSSLPSQADPHSVPATRQLNDLVLWL